MLLDVVFLVNKDYQTEHLCLLGGGGGVRPNPTNLPPHYGSAYEKSTPSKVRRLSS